MPQINLSDYDCILTRKEFTKLYKTFFKKLIPSNIKSSKNPICNIYMGPPGSGKSFLSARDKGFVIIDGDIIISELPNMLKLEQKGIKHGNMIESCNNIGEQIWENIYNYCITKKYNISIQLVYGPSIDELYQLKKNGYTINSYFVYTYNAYENNIKRKILNLSKKRYLAILTSMEDLINIFAAYNCSDTFQFACYNKRMTAKSWEEVVKKIHVILNNIRKHVR